MPYTEKETKQTRFQEVLIDRAAAVSEHDKGVRENLLTNLLDSMPEKDVEAVDKFLSLLCGTGAAAMRLEADINGAELAARFTSNMDGMSQEQRKEYRYISEYVDIFAEEMKSRFAKKIIEGRRGFDGEEIVKPVHDEIADRLDRMAKGEHNIGVGIGNWAFIHWFRQNVLPY